MKRGVAYIIIFLTIVSCGGETTKIDSPNGIEIGDFAFHFPNDFKLINEKGIDSNAGKITNGKIDFQFDYGYYSNTLEKSAEEYLSEDVWKINALPLKFEEGDTIDFYEEVSKMTLLKIQKLDTSNYELQFRFSDYPILDTIFYTVKVSDNIVNAQIKIDTIDNVMYKYVTTNEYVGLYAKDLNSFNSSIGNYKALSIIAKGLTGKEKQTATDILKSCRLKK